MLCNFKMIIQLENVLIDWQLQLSHTEAQKSEVQKIKEKLPLNNKANTLLKWCSSVGDVKKWLSCAWFEFVIRGKRISTVI